MSTRHTTVRVVDEGVVLYQLHRERLGAARARAFDAFAEQAQPGLYSLLVSGSDGLEVVKRERSRLVDGATTRSVVSPLVGLHGPQPKQTNPSPYDSVRVPGVATLLTDATGAELWESCVAAILAWSGERLLAVPEAVPRVGSVAERWLLEREPHQKVTLRVDAGWPLLLVNAVTSCVPAGSGFPPEVRARLDASIASSAERP